MVEIDHAQELQIAIGKAHEAGRKQERAEIVVVLRELSESARPDHFSGWKPSAWEALDSAADRIEARGRK